MIRRFLKHRAGRARVAIIGLDCAEPSLVFERFAADLPCLSALRSAGMYGELESVIPAITIPAWSCMASGKDPGTLGIYGFRNRQTHGYEQMAIADSRAVREPRLWDILARHGKRSIIMNVPGTYPAAPIDGALVSCFLTPPASRVFTYPAELSDTLRNRFNGYPFDVSDFRSDDKARIRSEAIAMAQAHFAAARYLLEREDWDFFMLVEIGLDRMHHAFWRHFDPQHRDYRPASPFAETIRDYYRMLDAEIGRLLPLLGDDTHLFILSDHGTQPMDGGICLNEWLIQQGYLSLAQPLPTGQRGVRLSDVKVDWSKTKAWGEGGYYGRLFLNVRGREPAGIVEPEAAAGLLESIRLGLEAIGDENGRPIGTRCFRPSDTYAAVNGIAPDLLIYFGDLRWRSIGTLGWNRLHLFENDTGPDDANHRQHGLILYRPPGKDGTGQQLNGAHLLQIAPTILSLFGLPVPADMQRAPIEAIIRSRQPL